MRESVNAAKEGKKRPLDAVRKPGERRVERMTWPGTQTPVGLLYLNCGEQQAAHFAAAKWFRQHGLEVEERAEQFGWEYEYQVLSIALVNGETMDHADKLFRTAELARAFLTPNEQKIFIEMHLKLQAEELEQWGIEPLGGPYIGILAKHMNMVGKSPEAVIAAAIRGLGAIGG